MLFVEQYNVGCLCIVCLVQDCGFVYWNNLLFVLVVVVEYCGQMFLVCNVLWLEGMFVFVIGFFECDEMLEEGIVCELKEEMNFDV